MNNSNGKNRRLDTICLQKQRLAKFLVDAYEHFSLPTENAFLSFFPYRLTPKEAKPIYQLVELFEENIPPQALHQAIVELKNKHHFKPLINLMRPHKDLFTFFKKNLEAFSKLSKKYAHFLKNKPKLSKLQMPILNLLDTLFELRSMLYLSAWGANHKKPNPFVNWMNKSDALSPKLKGQLKAFDQDFRAQLPKSKAQRRLKQYEKAMCAFSRSDTWPLNLFFQNNPRILHVFNRHLSTLTKINRLYLAQNGQWKSMRPIGKHLSQAKATPKGKDTSRALSTQFSRLSPPARPNSPYTVLSLGLGLLLTSLILMFTSSAPLAIATVLGLTASMAYLMVTHIPWTSSKQPPTKSTSPNSTHIPKILPKQSPKGSAPKPSQQKQISPSLKATHSKRSSTQLT